MAVTKEKRYRRHWRELLSREQNQRNAMLAQRPRSFQCEITVRSEKHRKVLEEEYRGASRTMEKFPLFREDEIGV